jgi:hypothetical protein
VGQEFLCVSESLGQECHSKLLVEQDDLNVANDAHGL